MTRDLVAEALVCARASEAIYGTQSDTLGRATSEATMQALGFKDVLWIDIPTTVRDVCAFIASSDAYHLLVFRGTKTPQDWLTDLTFTAIHFETVFVGSPPLGQIHSGFAYCLADGLKRVTIPLSHRDPAKPLVITGHSLGGALAAISGACFQAMGSSVPTVSAIYTFGQPRLGLQSFCDEYQRLLGKKLVRFVNNKDIVPRAPIRALGYGDCGKMIHFDASGNPSAESAEWQSFLRKAFESMGDIADFASNTVSELGDHSMIGYRQMVQLNQERLAPLLVDG